MTKRKKELNGINVRGGRQTPAHPTTPTLTVTNGISRLGVSCGTASLIGILGLRRGHTHSSPVRRRRLFNLVTESLENRDYNSDGLAIIYM